MADNENTEFRFEDLYRFITSTGIIIPCMDEVRASVEDTFKRIFGQDLDVSTATPVGRLIEAISFLYRGVLGVNVQNASGFNVNTATGAYLDALGALFGVYRIEGEADGAFRVRLLNSQSRGTGYAQSIMNAVGAVDGVKTVYVMENGHAEPAVLPDNVTGFAVDPHSVYIAVGYDAETQEEEVAIESAVADAIYATKSAGCGYTDAHGIGTKVTRTVIDARTGASTPVVFYRPNAKLVTVSVDVKNGMFTGTDIVATTKATVLDLLAKNGIGARTTTIDIASAISGNGTGTIVSSVAITVDGVATQEIIAKPSDYISIDADDITVRIV